MFRTCLKENVATHRQPVRVFKLSDCVTLTRHIRYSVEVLVDYEQSLVFLGPSSKTRQTRK